MAYALILSSEKTQSSTNVSYSLLKSLCSWFRSFMSAPVKVNYKTIYRNSKFYTITMPLPEVFFSKNKIGKKRTLKKLRLAIKTNNIEHFLLEKSLKEYLSGEWSMGDSRYLDESIRSNVYLLFNMDPLKDLKMQDMTIALSCVEKVYLNHKLMSVLSNFKLVNVIGPENQLKDTWDEFMNETGVPVCMTDDFDALERSDIWISYEYTPVNSTFSGVKIELATKNILCMRMKKQYKVQYVFKKELIKKLGRRLVQGFDQQILSEFLLHMLIHRHDLAISEAEKSLGINIFITSFRTLC